MSCLQEQKIDTKENILSWQCENQSSVQSVNNINVQWRHPLEKECLLLLKADGEQSMERIRDSMANLNQSLRVSNDVFKLPTKTINDLPKSWIGTRCYVAVLGYSINKKHIITAIQHVGSGGICNPFPFNGLGLTTAGSENEMAMVMYYSRNNDMTGSEIDSVQSEMPGGIIYVAHSDDGRSFQYIVDRYWEDLCDIEHARFDRCHGWDSTKYTPVEIMKQIPIILIIIESSAEAFQEYTHDKHMQYFDKYNVDIDKNFSHPTNKHHLPLKFCWSFCILQNINDFGNVSSTIKAYHKLLNKELMYCTRFMYSFDVMDYACKEEAPPVLLRARIEEAPPSSLPACLCAVIAFFVLLVALSMNNLFRF